MSADDDHVDAQPPAGGTPPAQGSGRATLLFFLILAAGVALLSVLVLTKPEWLRSGDSYPQLGSLSLTPVRAEDSPLTLADLEGKALFLNFWGTWCPPCVHEFPDIVALEQEYRDRTDFKVLAVSCGRGSDGADEIASVRVETQAFLERWFADMPVYLDPDQKTRSAIAEVASQRVRNFEAVPITVLLDRQHRMRWFWIGAQKKAAFEEGIKEVLAER